MKLKDTYGLRNTLYYHFTEIVKIYIFIEEHFIPKFNYLFKYIMNKIIIMK